ASSDLLLASREIVGRRRGRACGKRRGEPRPAVRRAGEGRGRLARLAVLRVDDTVAAARCRAVRTAAVRQDVGVPRAVVAFLAVVDDAVAADARLDRAIGAAAVAVDLVPVVALLA